jgi:hypothetical protein
LLEQLTVAGDNSIFLLLVATVGKEMASDQRIGSYIACDVVAN